MQIYFLYLILITTANSYISEKIIELDYLLSFDTFFIKMDLGVNEKYFQIDLHSKFNSISKNQKFIYSESVQKGVYREIVINGEKVLIWEYFDKLVYKEIKFPDFYFYFFDTNIEKADIMTLSYKVEKEEQNLIGRLKTIGTIDKEIFGFSKVDEEEKKGIMYIGGIPKTLNKLYDYKRCNVSENWGCNITEVIVGNISYEPNEEFGYFQTSRRFIFAPSRFINFLNQNFIDDLIKKKKCFKMGEEQNLFCDSDTANNFPNITLKFGEVEIILSKEELFESYGNISLFMIYEKRNDNNLWMLGYRFFKNHPIFFDKENKEVIIFYNEGRRFNNEQYIKQLCIYINIVICILSIIFLIYGQFNDPVLLKDREE